MFNLGALNSIRRKLQHFLTHNQTSNYTFSISPVENMKMVFSHNPDFSRATVTFSIASSRHDTIPGNKDSHGNINIFNKQFETKLSKYLDISLCNT